MSRLRSYARLPRESQKVKDQRQADAPVHAHVRARSGGFCEVVLDGERCRRRAVEQHHVVKRSQGGPTTPDNLVDICRGHHDRTDWPLPRGRLLVENIGPEIFGYRIGFAGSKFHARGQGQ